MFLDELGSMSVNSAKTETRSSIDQKEIESATLKFLNMFYSGYGYLLSLDEHRDLDSLLDYWEKRLKA